MRDDDRPLFGPHNPDTAPTDVAPPRRGCAAREGLAGKRADRFRPIRRDHAQPDRPAKLGSPIAPGDA